MEGLKEQDDDDSDSDTSDLKESTDSLNTTSNESDISMTPVTLNLKTE